MRGKHPIRRGTTGAEHNITDICFGGIRFDGNDSSDVRVYRSYLQHLWRARKNHFDLVVDRVEEDLGPGGLVKAINPVQSFPFIPVSTCIIGQ